MKVVYMYYRAGFRRYGLGYQRFDIQVAELQNSGNSLYIVGLTHFYDNHKVWLLGRVYIRRNIIELVAPRLLRGLDAVLDRIGFLGGFAHAVMFAIIVRKLNPDAIVLQDDLPGFNFWFLALNKLLLKKKTAVDYNDLIVRLILFGKRYCLHGRFGIILNEIIVPRLTDKLIVVTEWGRNFFYRRIGKKEIYLVRELVDPKYFESNKERYVKTLRKTLGFEEQDKIIMWIGYVAGRAVPGLIDLIQACGISKTKPKLLIVGPGNTAIISSLKKLADENIISAAFFGYVQYYSETHRALFKLASVGFFSLPNEVFAHFVTGSKLAEYLAAGLPVIAPKLGGPSEVVKGNGLLYTPGNHVELAFAIDSIFNMNLEELGKKSKQIAQEMLSPESFRKQIPDFIAFLTK